MTATIRRLLLVLKWDDVARLTLKAFRAGKATQLAKDGVSLGLILQSGEWRSLAYLRYVDVETVEISRAFNEVYQSDEEECS